MTHKNQHDCLRRIPRYIINDKGWCGHTVWRQGRDSKRIDGSHQKLTDIPFGDFLSRPENRSGIWALGSDGCPGPGPTYFEWHEEINAWCCLGACRGIIDEYVDMTNSEDIDFSEYPETGRDEQRTAFQRYGVGVRGDYSTRPGFPSPHGIADAGDGERGSEATDS